MTHGCKIDKQDSAYFITFTVVERVNVFGNEEYKFKLGNSLNYCTDNKGMEIFAYVLMNTHMHLLAASKENNLSDIIRDFKNFTCCTIILSLEKENTAITKTLLEIFSMAANKHSRNKKYQLCQQHNHPEEVYSSKFTLSKIKYIHNNPVEAGIVDQAEKYYFSSAVDYAGGKSPVKVSLLNLHNLYY